MTLKLLGFVLIIIGTVIWKLQKEKPKVQGNFLFKLSVSF